MIIAAAKTLRVNELCDIVRPTSAYRDPKPSVGCSRITEVDHALSDLESTVSTFAIAHFTSRSFDISIHVLWLARSEC